MTTRRRTPAAADPDLGPRVVDAAIAIAEEVGWSNVRLQTVADRLSVPLADVGRRFRDLDAVANAWFERARLAVLAPVEPDFFERPARERLTLLMRRWFDALAPHRRITVQMLAAKMWPSHPHHWGPMVFNLSRTVLWFRDAAGLDAGGGRRQLEEIGLTGLFLATLAVWSCDETPGQERTRRFLERRLGEANALMALLFPTRPSRSGEAPIGP